MTRLEEIGNLLADAAIQDYEVSRRAHVELGGCVPWLLDRVEELAKLVREDEWVPCDFREDYLHCRYCDKRKQDGHAPYCPRQAALKRLEE